ncbi:MAG: hypothetical protein WA915_07610 [Candidatus Aminicenantaceae bacterium]
MISKTNIWEAALLYFDVGTVSQTVRSGNGPYKEKYYARRTKKKAPGFPGPFEFERLVLVHVSARRH